MDKKIEVWYLGHSGFAVGVGDHFLIFDYYIDSCDGKRNLASGVIEPEEIKDKNVLIFSSHRHPDHFNPIVLSWNEKLPQVKYFLSSDISKKPFNDRVHFLKPNASYQENNLIIKTFKSTDEGVAFLVTIDGMNIYHAGDLNWWHWDEEPKHANGTMEANFKHEISLIKSNPIDIAFLTADPRQENAELWGLIYFLENVDVKAAFPMHFGTDYSIMDRITVSAVNHSVLNKVWLISERGQNFIVPI